MNKCGWSVLLLCAMLTTPQAALIMKVTLSGEVSEEAIAHISKIAFSGDSMKVFDGADFALDSIVKIEFYEGDTGELDTLYIVDDLSGANLRKIPQPYQETLRDLHRRIRPPQERR